MRKLFLFIVFLSVLTAGVIITTGLYWFHFWNYSGKETSFIISPGDTFGKINQRLENDGLIVSSRAFYYLARYKNKMNSLNHGMFLIKSGMSLEQILDALCGPSMYPMVVIPEGKNIYEVAKILENANILQANDFISAAKSRKHISKTFDIEARSVEGYVFPNTYQFAPSTAADLVLDQMIEQFHIQTSKINFNHPSLSKKEVIILASIVEKETGAKSERNIIAGVFLNRLKKRMRLQSDPTTIYGIWERFDGNLRKSDLLEKTDYNTYAIPALPAGPIANPSLEAIKAVLNPMEHDFLYFVSKNDGTHIFSKSYAEHDAAVTLYQRTKANREGKSWRQLKQ